MRICGNKYDLMLESAWKRYDNVLQGIYNIETKAGTLLVANSVLIFVIAEINTGISSVFKYVIFIPALIASFLAIESIICDTAGVLLPQSRMIFQDEIDPSADITKLITGGSGRIVQFCEKAEKIAEKN
jgi:hypothetical protein